MLIKESSAKPQRRPAPEVGPDTEPAGLDWLLRTLWRRKLPIIAATILLTLLAALIVARIPPVYEATAEVLIDPRNVGSSGSQPAGGAVADDQMLQSQVRVLQSRNLAYKVIETLELYRDPEFNVALRQPSPVDRAVDWGWSRLAEWGIVSAAPTAEGETFAPESETARVVDRFLDALDVNLLTDSRVLAVTFASRSPERAAQGANKTAETYILDQLDAKYEATQRATQWLTDKIADLRRNVAAAEQAVQKFRSQSGLLQGPGGTMVTQQISDLNAQLIVVRTARAEAEQRLSRVRQAAQSVGGADSIRSPTLQALLDEETALKRRISELSKDYGDRHPQMVAARADLADVREKLKREIEKSQSALETEVAAARGREAALNRSLDQLRGKAGQSAGAEVQLRTLEREADTQRSMLEAFLGRFEQATAQLDASINETDARVISGADVPSVASFPPAKRILLVTFVISALASALVALLFERLDRGYRSGEQIEKATGLRALGLVPTVSGSHRHNPSAYLLRHPSSMFGESIRSLYTSILLSPDAAPPRKLLVTSSQPKEGKTTISVCLGRMRALSGHKTVIIEADLRRPSVHRVLDVPRRPGFTEVVLGEANLEDVLVEDKDSGAFILPAGKLAPDPTEILASPRVGEMLDALARRFELVVIDSPPLVAVADSRLLAPQVDAAILVVRWAVTPRQVVALAAKQLAEARANITGVVLSQVDSRKHARYGFADSAYYYGPVKRYYSS